MDASLRNAKDLEDKLNMLQADLIKRFTNLVNLADVCPYGSCPLSLANNSVSGQRRKSKRLGSRTISDPDCNFGMLLEIPLCYTLADVREDPCYRRSSDHHPPNARNVAIRPAEYVGREQSPAGNR